MIKGPLTLLSGQSFDIGILNILGVSAPALSAKAGTLTAGPCASILPPCAARPPNVLQVYLAFEPHPHSRATVTAATDCVVW